MSLGADGFTLLELLVAMTIVGILASLALPGYAAILQRARRNEAKLALLRIQHAQEKHYQRHLTYTDALDGGALGVGTTSESGAYALTVTLRDGGQAYQAEARVIAGGPQASDARCAMLTVDDTGLRSARSESGDTSETCWE